MSNAQGWTLGRTLPSSAPAQTASIYETTSLGWGNYNAAFLSFTFKDYHGITARSNPSRNPTRMWVSSCGEVRIQAVHQVGRLHAPLDAGLLIALDHPPIPDISGRIVT